MSRRDTENVVKVGTQAAVGLILLRALTSLTAFEVSRVGRKSRYSRHQIKQFSPNTMKPVEESSNFHYFTFMNAVLKLAIL